jgi:hypothetical protein
MSGELVVTKGRALIAREAITQEAEQRQLLGEYIRSQMVEGTDYGCIPGTTKKTLLKPGAEKLTQLYRTIPLMVMEEKVENWETGLFHYRFSCKIVLQADESVVVAEGVGSCSTYESRYRWRTQDRKCPACGKESIKRSKYPPKDRPDEEPGWYCFAKVGGCGANYEADDARIIDQPTGRVQNPDLIDAVNTVLKIAKKRCLVDAAISLARCSDIFTQDLDDQADGHGDTPKPAAKNQAPKADDVTARLIAEWTAKLAADPPLAEFNALISSPETMAIEDKMWRHVAPLVKKHAQAAGWKWDNESQSYVTAG